MSVFRFFYGSIVVLFLVFSALLSLAEENSGQEYKLESVTVTAQKREENVKDVAISMDVFSGMQVEDAGVTDFAELTRYSPNLFSTPSLDNQTIVIRGISTINTVLYPAAGLFIDDVSYPLNRMQNPDIIDVERIEILRGPQGTLYGKNTLSGAINIITRQPDSEFRGKLFSEFGVYDAPDDTIPLYRFGGSLNIPVKTDTLFMGLSFQSEDSDGYVTNLNNGNENAAETDHQYGQIHLRWRPADKWDLSFISNLSENNDGYGRLRYENGSGATDPYVIDWNGGNAWKAENNSQVIRARYKGSAFTLLSITSRSDYKTQITNDADFGPFDFHDQNFLFDNTTWSQEIRFSSPDEGKPFSWVGGVFASRDKTTADSETLDYYYDRKTRIESDSIAIFGQGTYSLWNRLHLTAGVRYEHQESEATQINTFAAMPRYSDANSDDQFLPKASISFDLTPEVMTYVTVSRGFLSGGYDFHMAEGPDDLAFDPEHLTSYEAGIKASFYDDRLALSLAVFHLDIKDKQVLEWPVGASPLARDMTNAAEGSSDGLELEIKVRPMKGFDLFAGFGYTDSRFGNWVSEQSTGERYDYNDKYLPYVPRYTFNAGTQYRSRSGLFMRADVLGTGRFYTDSENTQEVSAYETVNLKVGYEWEHYDIVLWAKNLFDETYVTSRVNYFGSLVQDGAPRSVGLTFTWRF